MSTTVPFHDWMVNWVLKAREISQGATVAGLLVNLADDPRQVHLAHTVQFPVLPAARALGVSPIIVRTALHRLYDARLLNFTTEDHPSDGPHVTVTLLPPPPG
jgi:hypothetical protein